MANESEQKSPTESGRREWLTEGILLIIGPAIGFLLVYAHEVAYCAVYTVPSELVRPDIVSALSVAAATVAYFSILVFIADSFRRSPMEGDADSVAILRSWHSKLGNKIWCVVLFRRWVFLMGIVMAGAFFFSDSGYWLIVMVFAVVYMLFDLVYVYSHENPKKLTLLERFGVCGPAYLAPTSPYGIVQERLGRTALVVVTIAVLGSALSAGIGRKRALDKTEFLVPSSHPNAVLVRNYGDGYICAEFDEHKRLTQKIIVLTSTDDKSTQFFVTNLGKIRPRAVAMNPAQIPAPSSNPPAVKSTNQP